MKKHNKGFIFLVTLLIISVISLLVLTSMQHILLYHKAINKEEELHQHFYQLDDLTKQLAKRPLSLVNETCVVHEDSANQVLQKLLHHQGCSLANGLLHYRYFIEDLGEFPCLIVRLDGKKRATYHRRVSVLQLEEGVPAAFLQIRFIAPGGIINCVKKERFINLGISSWRYLPSP